MAAIGKLLRGAKAAGASGKFCRLSSLVLAGMLTAGLAVRASADPLADGGTGSQSVAPKVTLGPFPGLPASLIMTVSDSEVSWVRLLVAIDDDLLILPLTRSGDGSFEGVFPTPREHARYSFQLGRDVQHTALSETFLMEQSCFLPGDANDSREGTIAHASQLNSEAAQLIYLNRIIERLKDGR